jgi:hypothetical protein
MATRAFLTRGFERFAIRERIGADAKDRADIDERELREMRDAARVMLGYDDFAAAEALLSGKWKEITDDDQNLS